jgi:uncharacterized protein (DUF3820 family)
MKLNIRKLIKDLLIKDGWTEKDSEHMLVILVDDGYDATITLKTIKMPFGKYKGFSIKTLDKDNSGYLGWLIEQDWFEKNYNHIYQAIIDMGYIPSKSFDDDDNSLDTEYIPF